MGVLSVRPSVSVLYRPEFDLKHSEMAAFCVAAASEGSAGCAECGIWRFTRNNGLVVSLDP